MFSKHIFILVLFFALIFIIAEFWYLIEKYTSDFTIKSLLINDLKRILKYRGIKYKSLIEKQEFLDLIKETGEITEYEYLSSKKYVENEGKCNLTSISVIPNEDLFNELVEDSKDSAWILMTKLPKSSISYSEEENKKLENAWCHIQSIYGQYGINMAVLDCGRLYNLCWERGFHKSPFVLVLPRGRVKIKDSVDFFVYPYSTETIKGTSYSIKKSLVDWLGMKMAHRINMEFSIGNSQTEESLFHNFPVHFVSIYSNISSIKQTPPMSVSAHSVRFTGRIHFWSGSLDSIPRGFKRKIFNTYPNWKPPGHFLFSENDLIYQYGVKEGQSINYETLQLFFRDLCPSSNDIFIWNLFLINLIISFHVAMLNGSFALRLGYFLWYFLIFNTIYCTIFLSLLSFLNISRHFSDFIRFLSLIWQKIAVTPFSEHIRYLQLTHKLNFLISSVVWMFSMVLIIYFQKRNEVEIETPETDTNTENTNNTRNMEPFDTEAGQQIAFITSLGSINLFLQQQPPVYLSKLFNWTFQAPQKWAVSLASKCMDNKVTAKDSNHNFPCVQNELQWPMGYIFTKECCICLGRFMQNEILCGLPCGHAFHDSCIKTWLTECHKDNCPQCRWPAYKEKP